MRFASLGLLALLGCAGGVREGEFHWTIVIATPVVPRGGELSFTAESRDSLGAKLPYVPFTWTCEGRVGRGRSWEAQTARVSATPGGGELRLFVQAPDGERFEVARGAFRVE